MTMEEVLAREEIRVLLATYNLAGDRGRKEEFASVFADDAILETPEQRFEGRNAIVDGLFGRFSDVKSGTVKPKYSFVRHNLTTSQVKLTGPTTAEGRTYFVVFTDIGADHGGVYVDQFRKEDNRWLIANRQVRIDFVAENALFTNTSAAKLRKPR